MIGFATLADVSVFETIDSTNDEVQRRIVGGATEAFGVASHVQTAGRGRSGRAWQSSSGNLAVSYFLPYKASYQEAARLSFAVSLAVSDTVADLAHRCDIQLKWPNDVLLNGAKVSGILLENLGADAEARLRLIVGIGLNLATHPDPEGSNWRPTSIAAEIGEAPGFDHALAALTDNVGKRLSDEHEHGFAKTRKHWLDRAARLGEQISARLPNQTYAGTFTDVDENGALVLTTETGIRTITAGDVFFPKDVGCC